MKTISSFSVTARGTGGSLPFFNSPAFVRVAPLTASYAATAKRTLQIPVAQERGSAVTPSLPNTGPQPPTGNVNASGSQTSSWDGTTISPGGNANTESTCMDNSPVLGCETFTLTVNGTQSDWAGKKVQVLLTWTSITNEYDIYVHKGSNAGPLVTSAVQGPGLTNQVVFIDASNLTTDAAHPTTVFTVHVVYDTTPASATDEYHGSATPVPITTTTITAAPQDTGPKIGFENFEPP